MKVFKKYLLMFALLGIGILAFSAMAHDAQARNCYWTSATAQNSGTPAAWNGGIAPNAHDNLFFSSNYTGQCTIDLADTFGNITLGAGAGTVVQNSVNFGYVNFNQAGGIWTGNSPRTQTCSGAFVHTGGTTTYTTMNMIFSGTSSFISTDSSINFDGLKFTGTTTIYSTMSLSYDTISFIVTPGSNVIISSGKILAMRDYIGETLTNQGVISGQGTFLIWMYDKDASNLGNVTCNLQFESISGCTANRIFTLTDNVHPLSLYVDSADPAKTMTLNLAGKKVISQSVSLGPRSVILSTTTNANVNSTSITLGISGSAGTFNINNMTINTKLLDCINGTLIHGIGIVNIWADGGQIKLTSIQSLNHLNFNYSGIGVPSWIISASSGAVFWNVTGLPLATVYELQANSIKITTFNTNTSTIKSMVYSIYGTITYRLIAHHWIPVFISHPTITIYVNVLYIYKPIMNESCIISAVTLPSWASFSSNQVVGMPLAIGDYNFTLKAISVNDTDPAYQNWTVYVIVAPPIMGTDQNIIFALFFLSIVTIFNFYGHKERLLAIQLVAVVIMLPGVVWTFLIMPTAWYIPLLFIMANVVLFTMDAARKGYR